MVSEGGRRCLFIISIVFQIGVLGILVFGNFNYGWEANLDDKQFDALKGKNKNQKTTLASGATTLAPASTTTTKNKETEHYMRGGIWYACLNPGDEDCFGLDEEWVTSEKGLAESWQAIQATEALVICGIMLATALLCLVCYNICINKRCTSEAAGVLAVVQFALTLTVAILMTVLFTSGDDSYIPRSIGSVTWLQWAGMVLSMVIAIVVCIAVRKGPKSLKK